MYEHTCICLGKNNHNYFLLLRHENRFRIIPLVALCQEFSNELVFSLTLVSISYKGKEPTITSPTLQMWKVNDSLQEVSVLSLCK